MRVTIVAAGILLLASRCPCAGTGAVQRHRECHRAVANLHRAVWSRRTGGEQPRDLAGGVSHSAHFNSGFESEFSQFGTALTGQIVSLPLPAPASGFTYQFDPGFGVFTRTTSTFGPILAERVDTIGARRVTIGFAYQRLAFDSISSMDLRIGARGVHPRQCRVAWWPRGRHHDGQLDRLRGELARRPSSPTA